MFSAIILLIKRKLRFINLTVSSYFRRGIRKLRYIKLIGSSYFRRGIRNIFLTQITVKDFNLAILKLVDGHLTIKTLSCPDYQSRTNLSVAFNMLKKYWTSIENEYNRQLSIPIFCLSKPNPVIVSGLKSLFIAELPWLSRIQIRSLNMSNPIEIRTLSQEGKFSHSLSHSIVDLQEEQIVILGSSRRVLKIIRILGERLNFQSPSKIDLVKRLKELVGNYHKPLGSSAMMGAFATIFIIVTSIAINDITKNYAHKIGMKQAALFLFSITTIAHYFFNSAFEFRLIAFRSRLNENLFGVIKLVILILLLLLIPTITYMGHSYLLIKVLVIAALSLLTLMILGSVGTIFLDGKSSKYATVFLDFILLIGILVITLVDFKH